MIGKKEITEILSLYKKHGWKPSRVLLSAASRTNLQDGDFKLLFGKDCPAEKSKIDAVWFVRPRNDGGIAWEIRLLSERPYALCESFPESFPAEQIEPETKKMENRLIKLASQVTERT